MSTATRESLTHALTGAKEEAKGQSLDLAEMSEASRKILKTLQGAQSNAGSALDEKVASRVATLNASLRAYSSRLSNLQNEARAISNDADGVVKMLWGTEAPATPAPDFEVEVPPIAQALNREEEVRNDEKKADAETAAKVAASQPPPPPPVEDHAAAAAAEDVKVEVESPTEKSRPVDEKASAPNEPEPQKAKSEGETIDVAAVEVESPVDSMSITDITTALHQKAVDFSDCFDAKSLRRRYQDVLDGKFPPQKPEKKGGVTAQEQRNQPPVPKSPTAPHQSFQDEYQRSSRSQANTTETGLAQDPYPGALRKAIDPMKYVWQVKKELGEEQHFSPDSVDLFANGVKLDDNRRLYEYPGLRNCAIDVRQKG